MKVRKVYCVYMRSSGHLILNSQISGHNHRETVSQLVFLSAKTGTAMVDSIVLSLDDWRSNICMKRRK